MTNEPEELRSRLGRPYRRDDFQGRRIYVGGEGPAVIVLHELGGLDLTTLDVADRIAGSGFRVVMPLIVGRPLRTGLVRTAVNWAAICISREIHVFVTGRTSPIATWLRALASKEKGEHAGVGVVGMCFTGGFALATAVDESVIAAVASQPALPWALLPGAGADLGLSPEHVECVRERHRHGEFGLLAARYTLDTKSAAQRIQRYKDEFGPEVVMEPIGTEHSVLARAADPRGPDPIATPVLEASIALLRSRLLPGLPPNPGP